MIEFADITCPVCGRYGEYDRSVVPHRFIRWNPGGEQDASIKKEGACIRCSVNKFAMFAVFISLTAFLTVGIHHELTMTTPATYSGETNAIIQGDGQINTNIVRDCLCDACCICE